MLLLLTVTLLSACATRGELEYITQSGERKTGCETEYVGAPSVDKYAVEYILSHCAKILVKQGHQVIDKRLLELDLSTPEAPNGKPWSFEYATELYKSKQLTDKEYGYIIAYVDINEQSPD